MAVVKGYIEKIKYRNEENGYTVLSVSGAEDGEEYILVGTFSWLSEGEMIEAEGRETVHPVYGEQLAVEKYTLSEPDDLVSMERYLGSGAIKGVGAALARRIIKKFKQDTFRVMEEEPEKLAQVKGISERMAMQIADQVEEKRDMRQAMMFLQGYGISISLAVKIYKEYGPALYSILKKNPYQLADDISGIGFRMADEIAARSGIAVDSDFRIRSGILYTLFQASAGGNTCLPGSLLIPRAAALLGVTEEDVQRNLMNLQIDGKIQVRKRPDGNNLVYAAAFYHMEDAVAHRLLDLNISGSEPEEEIRKNLDSLGDGGIRLDELQIQAVVQAVNRGVLIITGGPGTGKTTTINTIIRYFERGDLKILLAAPTGRAAKRMTEATHREAKTIHRLLEISGMPREDEEAKSAFSGNGGAVFGRNEDNPLEADVVIIDEMSMVDIALMNALLKAVSIGTRLILVGDVDQLPSVGPGNVLRDLIRSGCFPVVRLTRIFRQAAMSDIIVNAHRINSGEHPDLAKPSRDFLFIRREDANAVISCMITLVSRKLPGYVHADPYDIQIMTPMRRGPLGVERLNGILQRYLNPPSPKRREKELSGQIWREGDKVMQIRNNYQMQWTKQGAKGIPAGEGTGVYNGDIGVIREINDFAENVTVEFDEGRRAVYPFDEMDNLELAYAITIHKSQGTEYPAVVLPLLSGPRVLMTRNLLYTAVTRAKACVCIVGIADTVHRMIDNEMEEKRYSGLGDLLREISGGGI